MGSAQIWRAYMGVSKNRGTPKSSILRGFSIINHPFWGTPILETPIKRDPIIFLRMVLEPMSDWTLESYSDKMIGCLLYPYMFLF